MNPKVRDVQGLDLPPSRQQIHPNRAHPPLQLHHALEFAGGRVCCPCACGETGENEV